MFTFVKAPEHQLRTHLRGAVRTGHCPHDGTGDRTDTNKAGTSATAHASHQTCKTHLSNEGQTSNSGFCCSLLG